MKFPNLPTHSFPLRTHPKGIARTLLHIADECKGPKPSLDPNRPLIDLVQEASLNDGVGLHDIEDHRAFRETLRKAKCFTLDADTSAMVADLSLAVADDLEAARQMALPPFPVTWFELDNVARLNRIRERGVPLTPTARGETPEGPPVPRVGWLITPDNAISNVSHSLTYFTAVDEGVLMSPLSYLWTTSPALSASESKLIAELVGANAETYAEACRLAFGMRVDAVNIDDGSYAVARAPFQRNRTAFRDHDHTLMTELSGELRHMLGLLVAISAGGAGLTMSSSPQARPEGPYPVQPNGKPLLPLEHHHLHLHLGKRKTVERVITEALTQHRKRFHDVRAHMRRLASGRLVPVKSHSRGDPALGTITKDYQVER